MEKCKLCLINDADKKGSHIVPHFLLKRIENVEGKTGRDNELGFTIDELNTTSYFGRSVTPEKLEEVFGEITDDDIEKNNHPLIVDNFFCSSCEKRFAVVESEYAKSIEVTGNGIYETGVSGALGFLFWSSIFWRMSINEKNGFRLNPEQEEVLRQLLDEHLKDELSEINAELGDLTAEQEKISYKLLRCCNYSISNPTHLVVHPEFSYPFSILLDEYILLITLNDSYRDYQSKDFFGIKDEVGIAPNNNRKGREQILSLNETEFSKVCMGFIYYVENKRVSNIREYLDKLHIRLGGAGIHMPENIKREVFLEITAEEKKLGRKLNNEDLISSVYKVLSRYA